MPGRLMEMQAEARENCDLRSKSDLSDGLGREVPVDEVLREMDVVDELIRWASAHCPDVRLYNRTRKAFWRACNLIAGIEPPGDLKAP